MKTLYLLAALTAFTSSAASLPAAAGNVCESEMTRAAKEYDVPLGVLYAVGLTETATRTRCSPTP